MSYGVRSAFLVIGSLLALTHTTHAQGLGATPADQITRLPGFEVDLLYSVPGEDQGSWVALTVDDRGRIIAGDQYGKLYRITLSEDGKEVASIEPIDLPVAMAQGLLYAFDSLYISVNANQTRQTGPPIVDSGLYRARDTDGDDKFDELVLLRKFGGRTEHGPHAVILGPDGKSIYVCAGNHTNVPDPEHSCVPRNWDEDFLLSRMWDARGHAQGRMAPGGWIARTDPDGNEFELIAVGFRNQYDIAFNPEGELFTYDADMEWDIGTPWYRPTRVNHVISGADFGWRSGTGKWSEAYPDSFGSVVDIGPGSPTGIVFGTDTNFPEPYRQALFIADWSYGIVYAVHLTPDGASYTGVAEKFLSAQPLNVTDMIVHPNGALYFTIGGRQAQSALYRVSYTDTGKPPAPELQPASTPAEKARKLRQLRHQLEAMHQTGASPDLDLAFSSLAHDDRAIRHAARVALEHQPIDTWLDRALALDDTQALIEATVAIAHNAEEAVQPKILNRLTRIDPDTLTADQQIDLLRVIQLVYIRLGRGSAETDAAVIRQLNARFPGDNREVNHELARLLVYLEAPGIVDRVVDQLTTSRTQEDQILYALILKDMRTGWTTATRRAYFNWFNEAAAHRGGMSFGGFLTNIRTEAIATLTDDEKAGLEDVLTAKIQPVDPIAELNERPFVRTRTVDEIVQLVESNLTGRNFERGREMFAVAACFRCHRVRGEGGSIGPDLTGVAGRFNNRDLAESIIEPAKVISDQYAMTQFVLDDGRVVTGRVINLAGDRLMVLTNMFDPSSIENVERSRIELMQPAATSMMPDGLLDRLTDDEVLDLFAYLKSGGNPNHEVFQMAFETTDTGLQFRIIETGTGQKPTPQNTVVCHYRGWLEDGKEFDSSYSRGQPAEFPLAGVIAGWTEGLQKIGEGGKIELRIPAALGYGERGAPPVIPANATLNFEVELIDVK